MSYPPDYAYILWDDICDIIGQEDEWPTKIRNLFWQPNCKHVDRFQLATYVVVNGLNPEVFMEWVDVMHLARDLSAKKEFESLLNAFNSNPMKWNNICNHQYEYLNGEVKYRLAMSVKAEWFVLLLLCID